MAALKIKGIPVWQLNGVTEENLAAVKETKLWVHYKKRGNDCWCICAPEMTYQLILAKLATRDISDGGAVSEDNQTGKLFAFICCATAFGISTSIWGAGGGFLAVFISGSLLWPAIMHKWNFQYGELIEPLTGKMVKFDGEQERNISTHPSYVDIPGNVHYPRD